MTTQLESSLAAATLHHSKVDLSKADAALPPVTFPVRFTQLFINGQWVDSASKQLLDVINPHTGNVIARVSEADAADVDEAVKAARHAFESTWRHVSPGQRADLMFKLADLMEQHIDELASLESLDNGKSFTVARGVDVTACISTIRYFAGWATKIHGKTIEPEGHYQVLTRHEPFGVVGAIVPWNFPLLMAVWKLGPCLSTGNTMVLKSSEKTPLSVLLLAELARLAGFPPGVFNVLSGYGHTVGQALAMHMDVDKVAFTGSTATGRKIVRASADSNLKKVTVELGGKSPAIVFPDVNLDEAVEGAHFGLFFNHGQVCCAGSRVFVHESVYDEFVKRSVARAQKLKLAAHVNAAGSQGPQVDDIQQKKILEYIDLGKKEGASLMCGGGTGSSEGFYIEPTVFADVSDSMTIAKEEIFGPVMSILKFSTIDEVITRANQTTFGLAASVWTNDINKATFVANNLRSGSVWINCHNVLQPCIPFGGYKQSGFGRDLGEYALHEYTQVKAIVTKCASKVEELKINMYQ